MGRRTYILLGKRINLMNNVNCSISVLMVTPRYFPYVGGIETHVHEVGLRLAERGVKVTLLTTVTDQHISLPREEQVEGIRVIRVRAWPAQRDYYFAPEISTVVENGNWDLVHCQGCHTFVPPLAMLAAKRAQIPYVVTFHSGGHSSRLRTLLRGMQWHLLRPLFASASKLIGVSRFEADYFRRILRIPAEKFAVVPNGSLAVASHPVSRLSCLSTQSLIISVGRLERYKGHHRLITALPKIRQHRPDAHLLILGSGPYEMALRKLSREVGVADHVEIRSVPAGERQMMAELLSQASLVALLSEYEAHPIAIMEALALRCPVLVTYTSGLSELAEQRLVRAVPLESTAEEIARAALSQMDNPLLPAQFTLPTWENCVDSLLSIYNLTARSPLCVF